MEAVQSVLQGQRSQSEEEFSPLVAKVKNIFRELDVEIKKQSIIEKSAHRSNAGVSSMTTEAYYRINVFIPALEHVTRIQDMGMGFGRQTELTAELSKLLPKRIVADTTT